jgi:dihydrofolate synthase/folylpolyglutamate synthase
VLDCGHPNNEIQKRLERIYALNAPKMNFRLDEGEYIELLAALGNPHLNLPPVIHIAGTNGKGSTLAFLKSLCEGAGLSVHTYSSPHLLKFNERITLNGKHIDDEKLIHYLDGIEEANDGAPLSFFEFTTAMAFKAFADHPADICILETGLGGRLDCTNVVPNPLATIITAIGYDHMDWLGADITTIADEKAGIMKADTPCFIAPQYYDVMDVFDQKSHDVGCKLYSATRDKNLPPLGLIGDHQMDNASVALACFNHIHPNTPRAIIDAALASTYWPARMERLSDTPEIWFDCGHNTDGARAIATHLKSWRETRKDTKVHLVLGLASDKNPNDFLAPLLPYIDSITCVDLLNARNPQNAIELANKIRIFEGVKTATAINDMNFQKDHITLVAGSLYLYADLVTKF